MNNLRNFSDTKASDKSLDSFALTALYSYGKLRRLREMVMRVTQSQPTHLYGGATSYLSDLPRPDPLLAQLLPRMFQLILFFNFESFFSPELWPAGGYEAQPQTPDQHPQLPGRMVSSNHPAVCWLFLSLICVQSVRRHSPLVPRQGY